MYAVLQAAERGGAETLAHAMDQEATLTRSMADLRAEFEVRLF